MLQDLWGLIFLGSTISPMISIMGWILPIIAIIFGIIGIIVDKSKGMAIVGLILGILGLIVRILVVSFLADLLTSLLP
jgi:hypothetical protein